MRVRTRFRVAALLALLALVAAACNGEEAADEPAEDDAAEEEAPVDEEEDDDAAAPEDEEEEDPETDEAADAEGLLLGYILPETGALAFLGPPMISSAQLAVEEINETGGVLGDDVTLIGGDEAGDTAVASETAERLIGENVDAIIGGGASGMSLAFIDAVTGAGIVQCSPSNTAPTFTDYDDDGFYFRTAPSDALQGPVLAEAMLDDGYTSVALMGRADDYGQGLVETTRDALAEQGADVVAEVIYDPEAATFDSEVEQVVAGDPEAIAIVGFDESAQIIQGLIEAGSGPAEVPLYGADGLRSNTLWEQVDPGDPAVLEGLRGTAGYSEDDPGFIDRLMEFDPDLTDTLYGAQSYDCTNVIALAAVAADSIDSSAIRDEMADVTRDGESCSGFTECAELLEQGEDIDYQGVSGPLELNEVGDPTIGTYEVWEIDDEGEVETDYTVESRTE